MSSLIEIRFRAARRLKSEILNLEFRRCTKAIYHGRNRVIRKPPTTLWCKGDNNGHQKACSLRLASIVAESLQSLPPQSAITQSTKQTSSLFLALFFALNGDSDTVCLNGIYLFFSSWIHLTLAIKKRNGNIGSTLYAFRPPCSECVWHISLSISRGALPFIISNVAVLCIAQKCFYHSSTEAEVLSSALEYSGFRLLDFSSSRFLEYVIISL